MNQIQLSIQALEAQLDDICRAMEPAELARFRADYAHLIPEVAAAQDWRAARKVLSHLRDVYGRYPAVRDRVLPLPGGQIPSPPVLQPRDEPTRDLSTAELANIMQAQCERVDSVLQNPAEPPQPAPPKQMGEK